LIIDSLGSGGAQRQIVNLATGLKGLGHHIEMFIYHPELDFYKPLIIKSNIGLIGYEKTHRISFRMLIKLRQLIKSKSYDAIISFLEVPNFYAEICSIGIKTIPLIASERSSFGDHPISLSKKLLRQFHRKAAAVTVNSFCAKNKLANMFPWLGTKLCVIYNGIDLDLFKPAPKHIQNSTTKLIAVGSVTKVKNPLGLVRALEIYVNRYDKSLSIDWVGRVYNPMNNDIFQEVNRFLVEHNLKNNWRWVGETKQVENLLPNYDALIHPSYLEGLSNAICEALACGLPILSGDVGDNPVLIGNNQRGIIFNQNNPESIASAIRQFVRMPLEKKIEMKHNARAFAEKVLSLREYTKRYEELIYKLKERKLNWNASASLPPV